MKKMIFVLKMMIFVLKMMKFAALTSSRAGGAYHILKNDDFPSKHDESFTQVDELCTKTDNVCAQELVVVVWAWRINSVSGA